MTLGTAGTITATVSNASDGGTAGQSAAAAPNANVSLDDFKNVRSALLASGYKHIDFAEEYDSSCEQHSYGLVEGFFKSHPCNWLVRAYLAVHDSSLGEVLVALSWVGMPNPSSAAAYKALVDVGGTGNIMNCRATPARTKRSSTMRSSTSLAWTSRRCGTSKCNRLARYRAPLPRAFSMSSSNDFLPKQVAACSLRRCTRRDAVW